MLELEKFCVPCRKIPFPCTLEGLPLTEGHFCPSLPLEVGGDGRGGEEGGDGRERERG